jgi:hypothetical protein
VEIAEQILGSRVYVHQPRANLEPRFVRADPEARLGVIAGSVERGYAWKFGGPDG